MKVVLIILAVIISIVVIIVLIGAALPANHVARVKARVNASPEDIWTALTDVAEYPKWRKDVTSVEILQSTNGKTAWRETGSNGKIAFEQAEAVRPSRLLVRLTDDSLPFGGSWTYELSPAKDGTDLIITEDGIIRNPLFRLMARFIFGYYRTQEGFLRALGAKFNHAVTPVRL